MVDILVHDQLQVATPGRGDRVGAAVADVAGPVRRRGGAEEEPVGARVSGVSVTGMRAMRPATSMAVRHP
jgi:hypothetical protein